MNVSPPETFSVEVPIRARVREEYQSGLIDGGSSSSSTMAWGIAILGVPVRCSMIITVPIREPKL